MKPQEPRTYAQVIMTIESGCNVQDGEYSLKIVGLCGALCIDVPGGVDDAHLITECIQDHFDFNEAPAEGCVHFIVRESGEREDMSWHRYFEIERFWVEEFGESASLADAIEKEFGE